jgi:hypothetical protein
VEPLADCCILAGDLPYAWSTLQPVQLAVVRELEDELINNTINANRSTGQLEVCISRVVEDEVASVEV